MFVVALWATGPIAQASQESETSCGTAEFSIDAQQTIPFFKWDYKGSPWEGQAAMHVTVPSRGYVYVNAATGYGDPAPFPTEKVADPIWADGPGSYGIDIPLPWDLELAEPYENQESVTVEYEVVFGPLNELNQQLPECVKMISIEWVPAEAPSSDLLRGCVITVEVPCFEMEVSLSIEGNVWSGTLSVPPGGERCLKPPGFSPLVGFEKRKADGTWRSVSGWGEIKAKQGVYSITMNRKNRFWTKELAKLYGKGTFRALSGRFRIENDHRPDGLEDYACGLAISPPVKKT